MPPAENQNRIEELKKSLYSRSAPDVRTRRKLRFTPSESTVQTAWERPPEDELAPPTELNTAYKDHSMSFLSKFLIASFIFCIVAVGLGAYLFFNGANLISGDNIDISIRGPVSIPGGAPVSFDITVVNKNNADLQGVDLSVDFPEGTTDPLDSTKERKNFRELLGDIPAGGTAEKTVGAIMFGEENLQKQIGVTATYKVKGSTALFTKTTSYDVLINSSPIFLTVDAFDTVTSGQEFTTKVSLKSNSQDTLKNVILKAAYPFGYTFVSSDIKPLADNMTWKIGDIPPGAERVIKIRGKIQGEDSERRVFRFTTGAQSASDPKAIGTQYMSAEQSMTIEKPFISMNIAINGDDAPGDHVSQFGQNERVSLNWFNNLPTTVSNMVIKAKLSGTAYDKNTIQPEQGYFDSANDTVVWDQKTVSDLASVGAGDSGTVTFTFSPKDLGTATNPVVNPSVVISTDVAGKRTQETGVSEKLSSVVSRTTRVSSNIGLTGRIIRNSGPFGNTGPIPPRAEQQTTYTVVWTVDNTSSTVGSAQVTATLPPYVKWQNTVSPQSESVTYDEHSGQVTWNIGNVSANTQSASRRREAYFQISLQPGINQVGDTPILVDRATFTAIDNFTAAQLQSQQDALTTRFSTDSSYQEGQAVVTK